MQNTPKILMLGIGLASTSLALALHDRHYPGEILLFDQNSQPDINKTWCFWGKQWLPEYLRPLICKTWQAWQISDAKRLHHHYSSRPNHDYCCIRAQDFFQFADEKFASCRHLSRRFGKQGYTIKDPKYGVSYQFGDDTYHGDIGFDSRPAKTAALSTGLYQCFTGAWVAFSNKTLQADTAGLMLDLHSNKNGTEFWYVLPFSKTYGLVELTRFSSSAQDLDEMQLETYQRLQARYRAERLIVLRWERGQLPMSTSLSAIHSNHQPNWKKIGISGGMLRPATGYAFLPIQRWCQQAASALISGEGHSFFHPINKRYLCLDRIFLNVLKRDPDIGAQLFMTLAANTPANTFARFMTESATLRDLYRIIAAMPKLPFIKALL